MRSKCVFINFHLSNLICVYFCVMSVGNPLCSTEAMVKASVDRGMTNTELSMVDVIMIMRSYVMMYEDELEFKVYVRF